MLISVMTEQAHSGLAVCALYYGCTVLCVILCALYCVQASGPLTAPADLLGPTEGVAEISYDLLCAATRDFHQAHVIGEGGFGQVLPR